MEMEPPSIELVRESAQINSPRGDITHPFTVPTIDGEDVQIDLKNESFGDELESIWISGEEGQEDVIKKILEPHGSSMSVTLIEPGYKTGIYEVSFLQ